MTMNNDEKTSLYAIGQRRGELQKELSKCKKDMTALSKSILFNPKPSGRRDTVLNAISNGIAVFDGLMLGIKMTKRIKHFFRH